MANSAESTAVVLPDSEMDSVDSEWSSTEDDPDHLWCICRQPHNNKYMICCGVCKDLFHGDCVGVSQEQGREWEKCEKEWTCFNCNKTAKNGNSSKTISSIKVEPNRLSEVKPSTSSSATIRMRRNILNANSRRSRSGCVVLGCKNTPKNTFGLQPPVSFFMFPNRPYERERKRKWLLFTRNPKYGLEHLDVNLKKKGLICSRHFLGNQRSTIADSPNYNPTIFKVDNNTVEAIPPALERFERVKRRRLAAVIRAAQQGQDVAQVRGHVHPRRKADGDGCNLDGSNLRDVIQEEEAEKIRISRILVKKQVGCQCQTEDPSFQGALVDFHSSTINGEASTYVQHRFQKDEATLTYESGSQIDRSVGPDYRSVTFLGYVTIQRSEDAMKNLTSVSCNTFNYLLSLVAVPAQSTSLRNEDRLLLFLMKLSLGIPFQALGTFFSIHRSTATRIFTTLLDTFAAKTDHLIAWMSRRSILETLPQCFGGNYSTCRAIIHCLEIKCKCPAKLLQQNLMWSDCHQTWTVKFLVAIAPDGMITFLSPGYCGRADDSFIMTNSGFLRRIKRGDVIICDLAFPHVNDTVKSRGTFVVLPAVSKPEVPEFGEKPVPNKLESARIHVDRVIQSVRQHNILNIPFPTCLIPHIDNVVHVCCILVNMQIQDRRRK